MALAPGSHGIRWHNLTHLVAKVTLFTKAFQAGLRPVVDDLAQEVQDYAQENAPWEDRTGEARSGLTAEARHRGQFYYIDLYHTVDYGIWLEIRWSGTYAIIIPTLEHYGPLVMESLDMGDILRRGY